MYFLLELLTMVCLVVLVATILFVVGAAVIMVDEGLRSVVELSANSIRQVASFSSATPTGWRMIISDQLGSFDSKASKL